MNLSVYESIYSRPASMPGGIPCMDSCLRGSGVLLVLLFGLFARR